MLDQRGAAVWRARPSRWPAALAALAVVGGFAALLLSLKPAPTAVPTPAPAASAGAPTASWREAPTAPSVPSGNQAAAGHPVYKCVESGRVCYAHRPDCLGVLSVVAADPNLNLMVPDPLVRQRLLQPVAPPAPSGHAALDSGPATPAGPDRDGVCALLSRELSEIDSAARQAQSAANQDRLRAQRQTAQRQQMAHGC